MFLYQLGTALGTLLVLGFLSFLNLHFPIVLDHLFGVLALRISRAGQKLSITSFFENHRLSALLTRSLLYPTLILLIGGTFLRHFTSVLAFRILAAGHESAKTAPANDHLRPALIALHACRGFLLLQILHVFTSLLQLFGETLVEFLERVDPVLLAALNFIQTLLQLGRVVVGENPPEVQDQQFGHHLARLGRHKSLLLLIDVVARSDDGKNLGIGGRTSDALFLQSLDQGSLGISWRGLSELLLRNDLLHLQLFPFFHLRQRLFVVLGGRIIAPFPVKLQETVKLQHRSYGLKKSFLGLNLNFRLVELSRSHLGSHKPPPDQLIEPILITAQKGLDLFRSTKYRSGPNRLMGVLGSLLALVDDRFRRQVVLSIGGLHILTEFGQS